MNDSETYQMDAGRCRDRSGLENLASRKLTAISECASNQRWGKVYRKSLAYLNCAEAKKLAALRALPNNATDSAVVNLAERVNVFEPYCSPVFWELQPKQSGSGHRVICTPPPGLKARSYLIKDVLQARFQLEPHLFDLKLRGRDQAARAIKEALEAGYTKCFVGDVRDCYQHVRIETLANLLPLQRAVVENSLDYRNLTLRERGASVNCGGLYTAEGPRWNGPRGLLQGLPSSNIILAILFNSLAAHLSPHDCRVVLYGDNVFLAAPNDETLGTIIAAVRDYFHTHPAGPFDLKTSSRVVYPEDGFEFLSYFLSFSNGQAHIDFGTAGWQKMETAIEDAVHRQIAQSDFVSSTAENITRSYYCGYRAISGWHNRLNNRLDQIATELEDADMDRFQ